AKLRLRARSSVRKKGPSAWAAPLPDGSYLVSLDADRFDLLFSVALGLECRRANLDPGRFGRAGLNDLALLRRLLLYNVVVGAGRRHQKTDRRRSESKFLQHHVPPLECTCLTIAGPKFSSENLTSSVVERVPYARVR